MRLIAVSIHAKAEIWPCTMQHDFFWLRLGAGSVTGMKYLLSECRCPEHGLLDSASPSHDKADICAVWDALCYGLPPPLALRGSGNSHAIQGEVFS